MGGRKLNEYGPSRSACTCVAAKVARERRVRDGAGRATHRGMRTDAARVSVSDSIDRITRMPTSDYF